MPIDFDEECNTVEITLGHGDVGIESTENSLQGEVTTALSDLGQKCCIGADLHEELQDLREDSSVRITAPTTKSGLNSSRILLRSVMGMVKNIRLQLLKEKHPAEPVTSTHLCIFCECSHSKENPLVEFFGTFVCLDCSRVLTNEHKKPHKRSLQERYDQAQKFRIKEYLPEEQEETDDEI